MQTRDATSRFSSAPLYTAAADFCPLLGGQEISLKHSAKTAVGILGFEYICEAWSIRQGAWITEVIDFVHQTSPKPSQSFKLAEQGIKIGRIF